VYETEGDLERQVDAGEGVLDIGEQVGVDIEEGVMCIGEAASQASSNATSTRLEGPRSIIFWLFIGIEWHDVSVVNSAIIERSWFRAWLRAPDGHELEARRCQLASKHCLAFRISFFPLGLMRYNGENKIK
jgi:hypothetical protein